MPVNIKYIETPNSMSGIFIVDDPDDSNKAQEFHLPKFIFDLVKAGIQDGTLNMSTLWTRSLNITKQLP